jgi:gas vesicle protein
MSNSSKILVALLGGLAAGLVLGVLFAPEKGEDTRRKVSDAANDFSEKIKTKIKAGGSMKEGMPNGAEDIYS